MTLLFADDVKMVTRSSQSMNLHSSLAAAWDWSKKWDLPINPSKCNYLTYGALVRPHLEYGMPACSPNLVADINHLERIQRLATRLVTCMRHVPYEERLQRLGPHSLQRRRLRDDLITAFKIFKCLLDIDPNLFFLPPARRGLRGHPFKELQDVSHRRRGGSAFSVRVVKYWNKLPASVVTATSVNVFKKRLEEVWTEVFPHLPH